VLLISQKDRRGQSLLSAPLSKFETHSWRCLFLADQQSLAAHALGGFKNDIRVEQKTVHNFTLRGLRFSLRNMRPSPMSGMVRMKSISDMAGDFSDK